MDEQVTTTPKRTTRTRKTATPTTTVSEIQSTVTTPANSSSVVKLFEELAAKIMESKSEFDALQRQIEQTKLEWTREQKQHEVDLIQRNTQDELERKREEETYQYDTSLIRKRAEDEFEDRKLTWEKQLQQRKDELQKEKQELEQLRKMVSDFDSQQEQAVKDAQDLLKRQLTEQFETERKLREQEVKAEKEVLGLKIANLEAENSRLSKEMEVLKRSLEEATRQVKDIAVKVIESGSSQIKPQSQAE